MKYIDKPLDAAKRSLAAQNAQNQKLEDTLQDAESTHAVIKEHNGSIV